VSVAKLLILDEAAREVEAASAYIEARRRGYGSLFIEAYQDKLAQIVRFPESGALLKDGLDGYEFRSFWIRRFGYMVIVGMIGGSSTIVAVMHHSRKPGYWRARL
jgi:plasmid stabilization system protein ParE